MSSVCVCDFEVLKRYPAKYLNVYGAHLLVSLEGAISETPVRLRIHRDFTSCVAPICVLVRGGVCDLTNRPYPEISPRPKRAVTAAPIEAGYRVSPRKSAFPNISGYWGERGGASRRTAGLLRTCRRICIISEID